MVNMSFILNFQLDFIKFIEKNTFPGQSNECVNICIDALVVIFINTINTVTKKIMNHLYLRKQPEP